MGDNQSDNSYEWGNPLIYKKEKIKMGHYDLAYEYEDDKKRLSSKEFEQKWGKSEKTKNQKSIDERILSNNITEIRIYIDNGRAKMVIDINGNPTYDVFIGKKETNRLLLQIIKEKSNG